MLDKNSKNYMIMQMIAYAHSWMVQKSSESPVFTISLNFDDTKDGIYHLYNPEEDIVTPMVKLYNLQEDYNNCDFDLGMFVIALCANKEDKNMYVTSLIIPKDATHFHRMVGQFYAQEKQKILSLTKH